MMFCAIIPMIAACFSDETSEATGVLTEIVIEEGSMQSVYNVNKNETQVIAPVVYQKNGNKPLSYSWEIGSTIYSNDEVLYFVGDKLGKYNCRLIVENADGKVFFPFTLYVNSPYEEGLTIVSKDARGNSMLSFMQKPENEGGQASFTQGDCFAINNPDESFAANVADIVQSSGSLIVVCQGGGDNADIPTVYYLNEKTLVVENKFTVPEYDDFVPTIMGIPSTGFSGTSYPVLCENGKIYEFSTTEAALTKPRKWQSTYAQNCIVNIDGSTSEILFWDNENSGLCLVYNGYGPYYCSTEYHLMLGNPEFDKKNYFANRAFKTMVPVSMTAKQLAEAGGAQEMLIITSLQAMPIYRSEVLHTALWGYDYTEAKPTFTVQNSSTGMVANSVLNATTPAVANKTFYSLLFADGNKVRCWKYNSSVTGLAAATELLAVGSDNAVITDFVISDDHLRTYVAFYEPGASGLNGSVWVFDTDKGTVLEKYDNVCYEPVKMIYKRK